MAATRVARVAAIPLATALLPATAFRHAKLLSSKPANGDVLEHSPRTVLLTFDESIATALCGCRCTTPPGVGSTAGPLYHPDGREELVAVRLLPDLVGRFVAC